MLEDEHSRHAAQPGLREGDRLARLHLLRAARDDPQPWGVPRSHLRHRLDDVRNQQRAGPHQLQLVGVVEGLVDRARRAHHHDRAPLDVFAAQRVTQFRPIGAPDQLTIRGMLTGPRIQRLQQWIWCVRADQQHRIQRARRRAEVRGLPVQGEHSVGEPAGGARRAQYRHLDLVDVHQHAPVGCGQRHPAEQAIRTVGGHQGAGCGHPLSHVAVHPHTSQPDRENHCCVIGLARGEVGGRLGRAECLQRDVHHHGVHCEPPRALSGGGGQANCGAGGTAVGDGQPDDALERGPMLLAGAAQPQVQLVRVQRCCR